MRVEFEVHTSHTKESFRILARMIYGAKAGWLRVLIFVLAIVIIAFGVIAMVQTGFSLSPLIVILLGCVLPLLDVRMVGKLSRAMAKSTGGTGGSLVYRFEEESFSLTDRDGRKDIAYGDVTKDVYKRQLRAYSSPSSPS